MVERNEILGLIILIFQYFRPTSRRTPKMIKLMYSYESSVNTFKTESETALKILSAKQISFSIQFFRYISMELSSIVVRY